MKKITNNKGRKFIIITIAIVAFLLFTILFNSITHNENSIDRELKQQVNTVEHILAQKVESTKFIISDIGREIIKKPNDKEYINNILSQYRSNRLINDLLLWTIFSWSNENFLLTIDGMYSILEQPIDLSSRDYIHQTKKNFEILYTGKPVYGSTSKVWMIPGGIGFLHNNKYIGSVTTGFSINKIAELIQQSLINENIEVKLFYNNNLALNVTRNKIELGGEYVKSKYSYSKPSVFGNNYKISANFSDEAISNIKWHSIYSRITEVIIIIISALIIIRMVVNNKKEEHSTILKLKEREAYINNIKKEFILGMNHELKNYTKAIEGLIHISELKLDDSNNSSKEELKDCLSHIQELNSEINKFVNDLLDINQEEDGEFNINPSLEETNIEDLIERSVKIIKGKIKNKQISIRYNFEENLNNRFNVDPRRIKQILVSVIANAIKFSSNNSTINITTKNLDEKVEIIITDNGSGISKYDLQNLIHNIEKDKSFRFDKNDIEFNLSIVKHLLEKQGGDLKIKSEIEKGTEVRIII